MANREREDGRGVAGAGAGAASTGAGRNCGTALMAGKTFQAAASQPTVTAMAAALNPQRHPAYTDTVPARYPLTALALISEPSYMLPRRVRWFGGPACMR